MPTTLRLNARQGRSRDIFLEENPWLTSRLKRLERKERIPDKFHGKTSVWQDYIVHFEQVASWNSWDQDEMAQQLVMSLRGSAQRILSSLTLSQLNSYSSLNSILTQRFNPKELELAHRCVLDLEENMFLILGTHYVD